MLPCFVLNRFNHVYAHVLYICFSATPGEVSSELSGDGTGPATEAESGAVPAAAGGEGQAVIM